MTTKEMMTVMQAYEDGKAIEFRDKRSGEWGKCSTPLWDWHQFDYRIESEPKYVPYDSVVEVEKDKWVKRIGNGVLVNGVLHRIVALDPTDNTVNLHCGWFTLEKLFEDFVYEDGTPCGKRVEG